MAMPTWQGDGGVTGSATTLTPTMPGGIVADDILLFVTQTDQSQAVTLSPANGFVQTASSPQDSVIGGGTRITAFWKRAVGSDSAPTTNDPGGDHIVGVVCLIRGVKTTGDPWNISSGGSETDNDTDFTVPGATTTAANCLVVIMVANGTDSITPGFTGWTNADLTSVTERVDGGSTLGTGGAIGIATGEKASAGAYGNTTGTHGANEYDTYITLAFEGSAVAASTPGGMMLLRSG